MGVARQDKTAIVAITKAGADTAGRLAGIIPDSQLFLPEKLSGPGDLLSVKFNSTLKPLLERIFIRYKRIVLFLSAGVVVRLLAPLIKDKAEDPAVVIVDHRGKFAISLLSGHIGGANALTREVASALGGTPVITTASDLTGGFAPDLLGKEYGWKIENKEKVKLVSAALVNGKKVGIYQDAGERNWLPEDEKAYNLVFYDGLEELRESDCQAALIITDAVLRGKYRALLRKTLVLRPPGLVVGIGCRRGTQPEEIEAAIKKALRQRKLSIKSVRNLATADIKKSESGINLVAEKYGWPVAFFSKEELNKCYESEECCAFIHSEKVLRQIGTPGVCEPAALLSSGGGELLMPKTISGNVTLAIAGVSFDRMVRKRGKLYLVGLGPGSIEQMTAKARQALENSGIIVGYKSYLSPIEDILTGKEIISSGMGDEARRARKAIELAESGKKVALVSGGDAGIYGMAGLVLELSGSEGRGSQDSFDLEIVPGVSALNAAASLLGAPLMCDFAVLNLSDLLVAWDTIALRLEKAAQADLVVVLYNPASKKRKEQILKARDILLKYRPMSTPVGIVTDAYRSGQSVILTDLEHLPDYEIGMNSLVIVGNSSTFLRDGRMVTPRGYKSKYKINM